MAAKRMSRVLCAADPAGSLEAVETLFAAVDENDAQAIALVGDLSDGEGSSDSFRSMLQALGKSKLPVYWVPGPSDAPVGVYLREVANSEVVNPQLRGVHGTAAMAPGGHILFSGLGGMISDDPGAAREEIDALLYPRWEAEYRLKLLADLDEHQQVMLFFTPPAHKGIEASGSDVVAELIATYRPRLVVTYAEPPIVEKIGRSVVVAPGTIRHGHYAVADLQAEEAELKQLSGTRA